MPPVLLELEELVELFGPLLGLVGAEAVLVVVGCGRGGRGRSRRLLCGRGWCRRCPGVGALLLRRALGRRVRRPLVLVCAGRSHGHAAGDSRHAAEGERGAAAVAIRPHLLRHGRRIAHAQHEVRRNRKRHVLVLMLMAVEAGVAGGSGSSIHHGGSLLRSQPMGCLQSRLVMLVVVMVLLLEDVELDVLVEHVEGLLQHGQAGLGVVLALLLVLLLEVAGRVHAAVLLATHDVHAARVHGERLELRLVKEVVGEVAVVEDVGGQLGEHLGGDVHGSGQLLLGCQHGSSRGVVLRQHAAGRRRHVAALVAAEEGGRHSQQGVSSEACGVAAVAVAATAEAGASAQRQARSPIEVLLAGGAERTAEAASHGARGGAVGRGQRLGGHLGRRRQRRRCCRGCVAAGHHGLEAVIAAQVVVGVAYCGYAMLCYAMLGCVLFVRTCERAKVVPMCFACWRFCVSIVGGADLVALCLSRCLSSSLLLLLLQMNGMNGRVIGKQRLFAAWLLMLDC
mmetsp:Transcript_25616/g.71572  ORF Transcript_25616/g.71572 Transcript_25616/m.71572 type:complete len:509 (-) Transcript_25616:58-1584(-)